MSRPAFDFTNIRIGHLTVLENAGRRNRCIVWRCLCDCGKETIVQASNLHSRKTVSCGCHKRRMHDLCVRSKFA